MQKVLFPNERRAAHHSKNKTTCLSAAPTDTPSPVPTSVTTGQRKLQYTTAQTSSRTHQFLCCADQAGPCAEVVRTLHLGPYLLQLCEQRILGL
jgi:hypothetical protein